MGQSSSYRCVATIEIPSDQVEQYDQLICEAASVFMDCNWHLLVPAQKSAVFDTTGAPPGLVSRLMNVWSIPDFDTLPQVMAKAADNGSYVKAQAMTSGEQQNLYVTFPWDDPIGLPDVDIKFYMMEKLHVVNGVQARTDLASYMNNAVYQMNKKYGWRIVFAANATTGVINEYVHIWGMPDDVQLEQEITDYRSGAAWTAAVRRVTTSLWSARPVTCFDLKGLDAKSAASAG